MNEKSNIMWKNNILCAIFIVNSAFFNEAHEINSFKKPNINDALDECVTKIIWKEFACEPLTFVYLKSDVKNIIEAISKGGCYSLNLRTFESRNLTVWNDIYIIITENYSELSKGLYDLKTEMFWNPRAYFIISTNKINGDEFLKLFETFLKYKIYKVVFINNTNKDTNVYIYQPFHDGNCGKYIEDIEHLGNCKDINPNGYFTSNVTANLKNCKFTAVRYAYNNSTLFHSTTLPILEQFVVDTFAHYYKYSVEYTIMEAQTNYGVVLPNRTVTGLLGQLDGNVADIALGSTVIIKNRADVFDYICGIKIASFKLFTSALGKEMWKKVYIEFDSETWTIILLFYALMVWVCIVVLNLSPKIPYSHTYLMVKLWGFFYFGNGTEPYSRTGRLRSVTAFWIWFTFFISSFYNSDMYSLITGHVQRKRPIDPESLSTLSYKPCISTVIATVFFFAYNEELPKSLDIPECRSIDGAFKTVAEANDLYTVQLKESYEEREKHFIDNEGNRKLDSWDFSSDVALGFYLTRGFPAKDQLQVIAQRMYETGLVGHYQKLVNPSQGAVDRRKKNTHQPFVLGDFRVHFGVLFMGSILSILTFLAEIIYYRKHNDEKVLM